MNSLTPLIAMVAAAPLQLAITVDDLPWNGVLPEGDTPQETLVRIAAVLRVHDAPATGFVVCDEGRKHETALRAWASWGLTLGNHGANHLDLNVSQTDRWLADAARCEEYLAEFGAARVPYFRFPLLHQGPTAEARARAHDGLTAMELDTAHVTVDTSEWLLASAYGRAVQARDGAQRLAVAREFERHVVAAVEHADAVARRKLGRPVPQVLLLHANALVADHLDRILLALRARGVEFVTLAEALADPVYARPDEYIGPKGLSWLYRMAPLSLDDEAWDDAEAVAIRARFAPTERTDPASPISYARIADRAPAALRAAVDAAAGSERMQSLLVMHRGELHAEAYFNGAGPEQPQNLKSVTKSLISALTGIGFRDGWLSSVDEPVARYLPHYFQDVVDDDENVVTIRHLLTMSSGLAGIGYGEVQASRHWNAAVLERAQGGAGEFRYDTPVLNLLTEILVRASGHSAATLLERELMAPIGGRIAYWRTDPQGLELGGNDAYLRPRDLLSFGELFRAGGIASGRRVLDDGYVHASVAPQITPEARVVNRGTLDVRGYGYLWWLLDDDEDAPYAALGHGGQFLLVYPGRELVIVMTSRWPGASSGEHYRHVQALLRDRLLPMYPPAAARENSYPVSLHSTARDHHLRLLQVVALHEIDAELP